MAHSDFGSTVIRTIQTEAGHHCALCRTRITCGNVAHVLDAANIADSQQQRFATEHMLVDNDFYRNKSYNAIWLCPTCHAFLTFRGVASPLLAIFLPEPVLLYLINYFSMPGVPLRQVDQILQELRENPASNPKAAAFLGLYRFLPPAPYGPDCQDYTLTAHLPPLSYYSDSSLSILPLPPNSNLPQNATLHRIYDLDPGPRRSTAAYIPFYDSNTDQVLSELYRQQLWRLQNPPGLLLAYGMLASNFSTLAGAPSEVLLTVKLRGLLDAAVLANMPNTPAAFRTTSNTSSTPAENAEIESEYRPRTPDFENEEEGASTDDDDDEDDERHDESARLALQRVTEVSGWLTRVASFVDGDMPELMDDDARYTDLETLAPRPSRSPCLPCSDYTFLFGGPALSAADQIWAKTARVEKSPWGMRVKGEGAYDLLAGPLPLSQPFNDFYRPRTQE